MERKNIPCPGGDCPVKRVEGKCYQDIHHEYWPKKDYKSDVEKEFRGLLVNQTFICRALHNAIHASQDPPEKPSRDEMLVAIQEEKSDNRRNRRAVNR